MTTLESHVLAGWAAGLFLRTFIPYLQTWLDTGASFNWRYTLNTAVSALAGLIGCQIVLPTVPPETAPATAFGMALAAAYTIQDLARMAQREVAG